VTFADIPDLPVPENAADLIVYSSATNKNVGLGPSGGRAPARPGRRHGAGRAMSRTAAKKKGSDKQVQKEPEARGVIARARGRFGLSEERPDAYKNVNDVVDIVHHAGLSLKVARMKPVGVIKG
jgi:RNA-splicing ligase RtcB